MKKNQGFAPVLILVAVLAVLAIGGLVYYTGKSSNPVPVLNPDTTTPNNIVGGDKDAHDCIGSAGYTWCEVKNKCLRVWEEKCDTTPAIIDNIANWKTYSNTDFSLKYPATWYLNTSSPGFIHITNYDSSVITGGDAPISPENIWIAISVYPPGKYNNFSANETLESWVNKIGLSDKQNILVDGIKAIRGKIIYTGKEESGYYKKGESSGDYVNVVYNNKGYQINYSPYGSKFISTFNQILSTFKFTNSSGEDSSNEILKNQPGEIKSITVKGSNQWVLAVDLLTRNPNWTPGGELPFFLNQNPKIRNLNVTSTTKTYNCNGINPDLLVNTSIFISNLEKANYKKAYFDINGSNITAIYQQCLP